MAGLVYGNAISTNSNSKRNCAQLAGPASDLMSDEPNLVEIFEVFGLEKDINAAAEISKVPKSRRRILNKINDNPLLHRLDFKTHHKISSMLVGDPKNTQRQAPSPSKAKTKRNLNSVSRFEENESSAFDSDGLSGFVVNDSSSLGEESSDSDVQIPPPRSIRRLVKGVKKRSSDSLFGANEVRPARDNQAEDDEAKLPISALYGRELPPYGTDSELSERNDKSTKGSTCRANKQKSAVLLSQDHLIDSHLELPCASLKLSPPQHRSDHKMSEETKIETPCSSPKPMQNKLFSPKRLPRIPPAPLRPSVDTFWSQDAVNRWNDEYSPRKMLKIRSETDNCESRIALPNRVPISKSPPKRNHGVGENRKKFVQNRHGIAEAFLQELDSIITEGKLSELASPTGGIKIIWSRRLNTTAGRANWKLETIRSHISSADDKQVTTITYRHHASIELAEKVIDSEDRLLNVIAHEFCHLANFMVSGVKNNPHGKEFKAWAAKCSQVFGGRGIRVTTKHSYDINYRYIWACSNCGVEFKRHSKSIDTLKHQCGSCKGKLLQVKPKPRLTVTTTEYQMFIKNNMKKVKEANPESPQKGVMGLLGKMYKEHKEFNQQDIGEKSHGVNINSDDDEDPGKVALGTGTISTIVKKLELLDLTSP